MRGTVGTPGDQQTQPTPPVVSVVHGSEPPGDKWIAIGGYYGYLYVFVSFCCYINWLILSLDGILTCF